VPGAVLAPIFVFFCVWTKKEMRGYFLMKEVRGCVLMAVIVVVVGILFPFHWSGENWDDDDIK